MMEYRVGDLFEENVEALVNTVNCVGVMGRGIALQFKKRFSENFKAYATACRKDDVKPGQMFVVETRQMVNPMYIINFPTKRHWKEKSRMSDIEDGLVDLVEIITRHQIRSIAIPPLGSGLGGLKWPEVKQRIEKALAPLDGVRVVVFEPGGHPVVQMESRAESKPAMTCGRAALVELMDRYLQGLLDPFITLLEVHKLLYFMQEAGEPLRLRYRKGPFGPYAENLRQVLNVVEGHLISGYADGGDQPQKQLQLLPGVVSDAAQFLKEHPSTREHLTRVTDLVAGFESAFGLELLSTVHWVMQQENVRDDTAILEQVYAWNEGKKQFTPRQIGIAADVLIERGWITSHPGTDAH